MIFILIGPPGAGKGTHSDALVRDFGGIKLATGDILRRHIKEQTEIGRRCEGIIAKGQLVDDATLWELLGPELQRFTDKLVILDGYPRNLAQARQLNEGLPTKQIRAVVHVDARHETLIERLCGRRVCPNCHSIYHVTTRKPAQAGICDKCQTPLQTRPDDQPDKVVKRLEVFAAETYPIVQYYQTIGLYTAVDGNRGIEEVYRQIKVIFREKMG